MKYRCWKIPRKDPKGVSETKDPVKRGGYINGKVFSPNMSGEETEEWDDDTP